MNVAERQFAALVAPVLASAGNPDRRERKAMRKLLQRPFWLAGADRAALFEHLELAAQARRYATRGVRSVLIERHAQQLAAARALRLECAASGFYLPGKR